MGGLLVWGFFLPRYVLFCDFPFVALILFSVVWGDFVFFNYLGFMVCGDLVFLASNVLFGRLG